MKIIYSCIFNLKINPEPIACKLQSKIKINVGFYSLTCRFSVERNFICVSREILRQGTESRASQHTYEQFRTSGCPLCDMQSRFRLHARKLRNPKIQRSPIVQLYLEQSSKLLCWRTPFGFEK